MAFTFQVRSLLPDDWYTRYVNLTLKHGLSLMRDVVTCPRPGCEAVVILDDETLGRCPQCELAFCPFCLKTYHGTVRCPAMPSRKFMARMVSLVSQPVLIGQFNPVL